MGIYVRGLFCYSRSRVRVRIWAKVDFSITKGVEVMSKKHHVKLRERHNRKDKPRKVKHPKGDK